MRKIDLIVIHCSATRADRDFTEDDLDVCHRRRGFNGAGYHFYIRKNGDIKSTREIERIGAHVRGYNARSLASVMRVGWIVTVVPPIPVPSGRFIPCVCLFSRCCVIIPVAVFAVIVT